jgi:hypothetical protein
MILSALVASLTCLFIGAALLAHVRASRTTNITWDELVAKIQRVESASIAIVAFDHLNPTKNQLELEPDTIWEMVGRLEGLQRMKENASVLIALAVFVERWNFDEGAIVAERMRRDGLALRRAVRSVEWTLLWRLWRNTASTCLPFHISDAATSYYLMRQRLLALYQTSHAGLYPRLAEAL